MKILTSTGQVGASVLHSRPGEDIEQLLGGYRSPIVRINFRKSIRIYAPFKVLASHQQCRTSRCSRKCRSGAWRWRNSDENHMVACPDLSNTLYNTSVAARQNCPASCPGIPDKTWIIQKTKPIANWCVDQPWAIKSQGINNSKTHASIQCNYRYSDLLMG